MSYKPVLEDRRLSKEIFQPKSWRNGVLIRSTNWLGDLLMTLPATYKLSRFLPENCGFFVLSPKNLSAIWEACPWVDVVIPMQGKRINNAEIKEVRKLSAGLAVVLPNSFGSAMDLFRCGIPEIYGRAGRFRSLLLSKRAPEWKRSSGRADRHQLSYYLELAAGLGELSFDTNCPSLQVSPENAQKLQISKNQNWLALAPGAAYGPAKQWPAEYFSEIAGMWLQNGGKVVLVGTKQEEETGQIIADKNPQVLNLVGKSDLQTLMSVLANVDYVLANDSGAMHLAAGLGTDGVAIFGSTDSVATGPIGAKWYLLDSKEKCSPCFKRTCTLAENEQYKCLKNIKPEKAFAELLRVGNRD